MVRITLIEEANENTRVDEQMAERAHQLGINNSATARQGVADAVRAALVESDRAAYRRRPERADTFWSEAETWDES